MSIGSGRIQDATNERMLRVCIGCSTVGVTSAQRDLQLLIRVRRCRILTQALSEPDIVVPFLAIMFHYMNQMCAYYAFSKNFVSVQSCPMRMFVADLRQWRDTLHELSESNHANGNIQDWLCHHAGNCRAPDMLNVKCQLAKYCSNGLGLDMEELSPTGRVWS